MTTIIELSPAFKGYQTSNGLTGGVNRHRLRIALINSLHRHGPSAVAAALCDIADITGQDAAINEIMSRHVQLGYLATFDGPRTLQ